MSSFIIQSAARQQVAELISEAERGRVRRQFRKARREARTVRRDATRRGAGIRRTNVQWADRIWIAAAR